MRLRRKPRLSGARLLRVRALHWSCATLRTMGELAKATAACEESSRIARELGDKLGIARALTILGSIRFDKNDLEGAKRLYNEALGNAEQIGAQKDVSGALNNVALILEAQGQLDQAKQRYEQALAIQRKIGFKADIPGTLSNIADLLRKEGNSRRSAEDAGAGH